MIKPIQVNPQNFNVKRIVFNDGTFSIAVGVWQDDGSTRFAMRWNGAENDDEDKGYPKSFGNPMWFQLPIEINRIISALIDNSEEMKISK